MSFLPLNNQENQYAPQGQTTPNPAGEAPPQSGGSAGDESGGGNAKTSAGGTPTQFGSSASKLGDYLSANAPQVQSQADKMAGGLNAQYGQLQGGIQNAANQFGQQVQGGYAAPNKELVNQAFSNPSQFVMNPDSVKAFQAQYNNQYTGPQNFEGTQGYGDIQGKIGQAVQQGNLLGTQTGLQSYLQGNSKNPTSASSTLDALLMRGNPGAQQTIQNAAGQFGNLTGQLGTATTGANKSVQEAKQAAQQSKEEAQQGLTNYGNTFNQSLQDRLNQALGQSTQYNQDVNQLRGGAQTYQNAIQSYLAQHPQLTNPGEANLSPWLNLQQMNAPQLGQVAGTQDYSNLAAINQLAGSPVQSQLNLADQGQAGTFALPQDLQAAIANGAVPQAMTQQVQGLGNQLTQAYAPLGNQITQYNQITQHGMDLQNQLSALQAQMNQTGEPYAPQGGAQQPTENQQKLAALREQLGQVQNQQGALQHGIAGSAQTSQWIPGAATDYNNLIQNLQAQLGPLNQMNIPNVNVGGGEGQMTNPQIEALAALANLQTLGIPADTLQSIGSGITKGLSDVGNWFGGLF